jgi:hypothetical protein
MMTEDDAGAPYAKIKAEQLRSVDESLVFIMLASVASRTPPRPRPRGVRAACELRLGRAVPQFRPPLRPGPVFPE